MAVPVLTAVSDAVWEAQLVVAFERSDLGVSVVRRCVDLADLLATATTGSARAVLLSADLRRLDRASLARLAVAGVVAVWGPTGAPGRTTVAVHLAAELAALGRSTLLVDADVYGGVVAQVLGLLDEAPGLAAAARLANQGTLDLPSLAGLARTVAPDLRVLSGVARADRWP